MRTARKVPGVPVKDVMAAKRDTQAMPKPPLRLLTVAEFAQRSGWRVATVRQKLWLRELPFVRLGSRSVRLREDLLEELITTVPALKKR